MVQLSSNCLKAEEPLPDIDQKNVCKFKQDSNNRIWIKDATPKKRVSVFMGPKKGKGVLKRGKCAGTQIGIKNFKKLATFKMNAKGMKKGKLFVPQTNANKSFIQMVDLNTCHVGDVKRIKFKERKPRGRCIYSFTNDIPEDNYDVSVFLNPNDSAIVRIQNKDKSSAMYFGSKDEDGTPLSALSAITQNPDPDAPEEIIETQIFFDDQGRPKLYDLENNAQIRIDWLADNIVEMTIMFTDPDTEDIVVVKNIIDTNDPEKTISRSDIERKPSKILSIKTNDIVEHPNKRSGVVKTTCENGTMFDPAEVSGTVLVDLFSEKLFFEKVDTGTFRYSLPLASDNNPDEAVCAVTRGVLERNQCNITNREVVKNLFLGCARICRNARIRRPDICIAGCMVGAASNGTACMWLIDGLANDACDKFYEDRFDFSPLRVKIEARALNNNQTESASYSIFSEEEVPEKVLEFDDSVCIEQVCDNDISDDGDEFIDCKDPDCADQTCFNKEENAPGICRDTECIVPLVFSGQVSATGPIYQTNPPCTGTLNISGDVTFVIEGNMAHFTQSLHRKFGEPGDGCFSGYSDNYPALYSLPVTRTNGSISIEGTEMNPADSYHWSFSGDDQELTGSFINDHHYCCKNGEHKGTAAGDVTFIRQNKVK